MDPLSMRQLWEILLAKKDGRTILISTHDMDEADIIGDRVAVMSEGALMCYGTPDFLKKEICKGYKLVSLTHSKIGFSEIVKGNKVLLEPGFYLLLRKTRRKY